MKRVCLFLDDKSIVILDELKYDLKRSKSEIVRKMVDYLNHKPRRELRDIMEDQE